MRPGTIGRILERFEENVENVYGVTGIAEKLLEQTEIVLVPPGTTIFDQRLDSDAHPPLYFVDSGFVTLLLHLPPPPPTAGGVERQQRLSYRIRKVTTGAVLGYTGFLRGVEHDGSGGGGDGGGGRGDGGDGSGGRGDGGDGSGGRDDGGDGGGGGAASGAAGRPVLLPMSATSDTYCQLLKLSSSAMAWLEANEVHVACRLYRLLCLVSQP